MSRVVPILIAVVVIAALTVVEGVISERWGDNRLCAYCVTLLDDVPKQVGPWEGEDEEVTDDVQIGAGARGYVSRQYSNPQTGEKVKVWLIVGHARDTARHTPDVCYRASGFQFDAGGQEKFVLNGAGPDPVSFFTGRFVKSTSFGDAATRVFWTWFKPESGGEVEWKAPDNIRMEYGAAPALFKLYFSTNDSAADAEGDESVCMRFAKEFIPVLEPVLAPSNGEVPADFDASTVDEV